MMFVLIPKRKVFGGEKSRLQLNLYPIIYHVNISGLDNWSPSHGVLTYNSWNTQNNPLTINKAFATIQKDIHEALLSVLRL